MMKFNYGAVSETSHQAVTHTDGTPATDTRARKVGVIIKTGTMYGLEHPKGTAAHLDVTEPGMYLYVRTQPTRDGKPSAGIALRFFKTQEQVDAHINQRLTELAEDPNPMVQHNVRLPQRHVDWLRQQPNGSEAVRDALDMWIKYMSPIQ